MLFNTRYIIPADGSTSFYLQMLQAHVGHTVNQYKTIEIFSTLLL